MNISLHPNFVAVLMAHLCRRKAEILLVVEEIVYSGGLVDGRYVSVGEQVALFLSVLSYHTKCVTRSQTLPRCSSGCTFFARHSSCNTNTACDRSMRFIYMLTGWEGSAADARVLRDALTPEKGFKIPNGEMDARAAEHGTEKLRNRNEKGRRGWSMQEE
ncbi:hypothetical protein ACS0TY_012847 [Phlomoides rotata]